MAIAIGTSRIGTTARSLGDRLWFAAGIIVVLAAIVALLTMFGPLGTFGEPRPVPTVGQAATTAGPIDLGNGVVCHQCGRAV